MRHFVSKAGIFTLSNAEELQKTVINVASSDIGFPARDEPCKNKNLSQLAISNFNMGNTFFLNACVQKVVQRMPFNDTLILGASCLNPLCALSLVASPRRFPLALGVLTDFQWMTGLQAQLLHHYYMKLCSECTAATQFAHFDAKQQRFHSQCTELNVLSTSQEGASTRNIASRGDTGKHSRFFFFPFDCSLIYLPSSRWCHLLTWGTWIT